MEGVTTAKLMTPFKNCQVFLGKNKKVHVPFSRLWINWICYFIFVFDIYQIHSIFDFIFE